MVKLMDCTLRDGGNVVGKGFNAEITDIVLDGLTACHVPIIEFGNAGGIGAYEVAGFTKAETDDVYLNIAKKYLDRGCELGMFFNAKRFMQKSVDTAKEVGLAFLRVGADAGEVAISAPVVKTIKEAGLKAYYSEMKAYLLSPDELAEEAKKLEDAGLDMITIMDSAGTMMPNDAAEYTRKLKAAVKIPVAFHCHNNLFLSAANAIAAYENGADILDCGLMGMARSAGNLPTEACVAIMQRMGEMMDIDLYGMLDMIDNRLMPAMAPFGYHNSVPPLDLVFGISGCHSSFLKRYKDVADDTGVNLYQLIVETSAINRRNPNDALIREVAAKIKNA